MAILEIHPGLQQPNKFLPILAIQVNGVNNNRRSQIRINIGPRPSILDIPLALLNSNRRNSNAGTAISRPYFELKVGGGLVLACEPVEVVFAVDFEVPGVVFF
jgi:hypothetical protein